jgi:predicted nucleic acid-binding Zn ribbon protein
MTDTRKVICRNTGCTLRNHVIDTALTECLSCGSELKPEIDFSELFGDLSGLFRKPRD